MIFVTIGTHPDSFERLVRKMDSIAPQIKEKIIIQRGFTKYTPKNCDYIDFADSLEPYFNKARLVIAHGAISLVEFAMKHKKSLIIVPRQKSFKEHINDHQVEFALFFSEKTGIKAIINIDDLTPDFLKKYNKIAIIKRDNLIKLQSYFKELFKNLEEQNKQNEK